MSSTNGVLTVSGTRDEFIDLILEKTIDVNAVSIVHGPNPALWRAIAHHRVYYVQRLLERGAALKNGPSSALSTLTWVLRSFGRQHREQFIEIAALLLKAGADPNEDRIMFNTIGTRCPEVLEMLLDHGADCNIRLEDGTSLLDFATKQGNQDVIKLLIEHGAQ